MEGNPQKEIRELRRALDVLKKENKLLRARVAQLEAEKPSSVIRAPAGAGEPGEQDKQRLLKHLRHEAFVHLAPSSIAGVGVFAIRPIPAGADPFALCNEHLAAKEQFSVCNSKDLEDVPAVVMEQVKSFFAPLTEDDDWTPQLDDAGGILYGVLATGLTSINVSWYLNHSEDPNVAFKDAEEEGTYNSYVTRRLIQEGEELTVNYKELGQAYYALVCEQKPP